MHVSGSGSEMSASHKGYDQTGRGWENTHLNCPNLVRAQVYDAFLEFWSQNSIT